MIVLPTGNHPCTLETGSLQHTLPAPRLVYFHARYIYLLYLTVTSGTGSLHTNDLQRSCLLGSTVQVLQFLGWVSWPWTRRSSARYLKPENSRKGTHLRLSKENNVSSSDQLSLNEQKHKTRLPFSLPDPKQK